MLHRRLGSHSHLPLGAQQARRCTHLSLESGDTPLRSAPPPFPPNPPRLLLISFPRLLLFSSENDSSGFVEFGSDGECEGGGNGVEGVGSERTGGEDFLAGGGVHEEGGHQLDAGTGLGGGGISSGSFEEGRTAITFSLALGIRF